MHNFFKVTYVVDSWYIPFRNLMNTGEVCNGAVISGNTMGNVDTSKLPGAWVGLPMH